MEKEQIIKRFLKYVSFDTQSNEYTHTHPSTLKQKDLGKYLVNELKDLGIDNAYMDEYGYVYATLHGDKSLKPLGLIAHMDTSPDASGKDIKPTVVDNYDGSTIKLNDHMELNTNQFDCLTKSIGHTIIHTDGSTLLGADDKAGIAVIMTLLDDIISNNLNHPTLLITFTPDEEIGEGADNFNYDYYKNENCILAYTLDGGSPDYYNYENFNACKAVVKVIGKSIHPGDAYHNMINSQTVAMKFHNMLPSNMIPEETKGYEGFNHLTSINGTCEETTLEYIIRNHDINKFNNQKELFKNIEKEMNNEYGYNIINVTLTDQYQNMKELINEHFEVIDLINKANKALNLTCVPEPIRGGTDGARLTYGGIYTPNLGNGCHNCHGPYEYMDVDEACQMLHVLKELIKE